MYIFYTQVLYRGVNNYIIHGVNPNLEAQYSEFILQNATLILKSINITL